MIELRVGLIGGGAIADAHLRGYAGQQRVAVSAVCDVDAVRLSERADELGVEGYLDYREMLASADIDAVDICLPHHLHAEAVIAAIEAGKHVLCEKPLAISLDDLDRIEDAAHSAGVTIMCAHNQIFRPAVAMARRMRDAGHLGDVSLARVTCRIPLDPALNLGWRSSIDQGGGALMDSGFHAAYLLPLLIDSAPVEAIAMDGRFRFSEAEAEDTSIVLVRFSSGAIGVIDVSWAVGQVGEQQTIELAGDRGALAGGDLEVLFQLEDGTNETHRLTAVDTYAAEIAAFGRAVLDREETDAGIDVARSALAIVVAARESQSSGSFASVRSSRTVARA